MCVNDRLLDENVIIVLYFQSFIVEYVFKKSRVVLSFKSGDVVV